MRPLPVAGLAVSQRAPAVGVPDPSANWLSRQIAHRIKIKEKRGGGCARVCNVFGLNWFTETLGFLLTHQSSSHKVTEADGADCLVGGSSQGQFTASTP